MKLLHAVLTLGLCSISTVIAQTVSLVATAPVGGSGASQPLTIRSNQVATLLHVFVPEEADPFAERVRIPFIEVTIGTNKFLYVGRESLSVSGPAALQLSIANTNTFHQTPVSTYCTVRLTDNQTQFTPSTAVVIPTDATGPVRILLEASADLVNWTDALPGIYGTSTTNRFFRVRAVRQ